MSNKLMKRRPVMAMSIRQENGEDWPLHAIVSEFPRMSSQEVDKVASSMVVIGQVMPGLIWKDPATGVTYIVDGSHRRDVAKQKEMDKWKVVDLSDLSEAEMREYVYAANLFRRHLTEDQRSGLGARFTMATGQKEVMSVRKAATTMRVSKDRVQRARNVAAASGEDDILQSVVDGTKTLAAAEKETGVTSPPMPSFYATAAGPRELRVTVSFTIPRVMVNQEGLMDAVGVIADERLAAFLRPVHNAIADLEIYESSHNAA